MRTFPSSKSFDPPWMLRGMLHARRERPRGHRTAEKRDELASSLPDTRTGKKRISSEHNDRVRHWTLEHSTDRENGTCRMHNADPERTISVKPWARFRIRQSFRGRSGS